MKVKRIQIENFRLLKSCSLDMTEGLTLVVGKNNTGKTSFIVLLEKFLTKSNPSFDYSDFPTSVRDRLHAISEDTNIDELSIRMALCIEYSDKDNLENISEFMLDLDSERVEVNILFEARIDKNLLLSRMLKRPEGEGDDLYFNKKRKFIEKNIGRFIKTSLYAYDDFAYEGTGPCWLENRDGLEEKEFKDLDGVIKVQAIHARRDVASSEESGKNPLSSVTTLFFKKLSESGDERLDEIRSALVKVDEGLESEYSTVFSDFLSNAASFLHLDGLKVVSDIEASSLIGASSKVIYGTTEDHLPENMNGLGYLNILFLLLKIEIARQEFASSNADLRVLFIEEPEAHTHPQMQSVFSRKIRELVDENAGLQAIVTTHSSYIVANSEFKDLRYLAKLAEDNVVFKNFHTDLVRRYSETHREYGAKLYLFLEQYLKIQNAELFFADKAIFVEGTTERILLPMFIKEFDDGCATPEAKISPQNISIIEAGANAKAFAPFLDFIGIKALVISDFDSTLKSTKPKKNGGETVVYRAHKVEGSTHTSNETLKYFLQAPAVTDELAFSVWFEGLKKGELKPSSENVMIAYQNEENGYYARSFEDAFLNSNKTEIKRVSAEGQLLGIKCSELIEDIDTADLYVLTNSILDKKSDFAASLLYSALVNEAHWSTPNYIAEGLKWISQ